MYEIVKDLVLPPGVLVLILAAGVMALLAGSRRVGVVLVIAGTALLYLLSTPYVAARLAARTQSTQPLPKDFPAAGAQAIVVLAAGLRPLAPEYGGSAVDETTLQRLAYAAYLARRYELPILVSGGSIDEDAPPLAHLMKESLEQVFGVEVRWTEDKSVNTYENALFSADILRAQDVSRVLLVTHAMHMTRALRSFAMGDLKVTPAPTGFITPPRDFAARFSPRQSALGISYYAIYEMLGGVWYRLRGRNAAGHSSP
jgi:uncharacterized SAM-binding protein YcdF (DUF218 family)